MWEYESYLVQMADMYSVGIILFEMCHPPICTAMERQKILEAVRKPDIKFPNQHQFSTNQVSFTFSLFSPCPPFPLPHSLLFLLPSFSFHSSLHFNPSSISPIHFCIQWLLCRRRWFVCYSIMTHKRDFPPGSYSRAHCSHLRYRKRNSRRWEMDWKIETGRPLTYILCTSGSTVDTAVHKLYMLSKPVWHAIRPRNFPCIWVYLLPGAPGC